MTVEDDYEFQYEDNDNITRLMSRRSELNTLMSTMHAAMRAIAADTATVLRAHAAGDEDARYRLWNEAEENQQTLLLLGRKFYQVEQELAWLNNYASRYAVDDEENQE